MVPINFLSRLHGYLDSTNIRHLRVNVYNYFSEKKYLHIMECKCPFRKRAFTPSRSHRISGINFSLLVLGFLGRVPNALSFYRTKNVLSWSKSFLPEQKFIVSVTNILHRHKVFEEALNAVKKFGLAQNILGPVKRTRH